MNIKDLIRNNIVYPYVEGGETSFNVIGVVLKTNPDNNTCKVKYKDKKGRNKTKNNVPVSSSSVGLIDWFPEKNDKVRLDIIDGEPIIMGEPFSSSPLSKGKATIESDVFSDNLSGDTEGGYIF